MNAVRFITAMAMSAACLGGCGSIQSALHPTGTEAHQVALLFWSMTALFALVLIGVVTIFGLAIFGSGSVRQILSREPFVIGAGLFFPVAVLTGLLVWGLLVMSTRAMPTGADPVIHATITGEQWWWRVTYHRPDGSTVESANELRIPAGESVLLELATADVLHSFWVPNLAGKLDMVPGRTNILTLTAEEPGISRGQCAEFCGGAHAFMSFFVVALPAAEFDQWLDRQAEPARPGERVADGKAVFEQNGCGGCHTVRGTGANGTIGPDLTHVGGRMSLAAGTLPNDTEAFIRWIARNQHIKPENRMLPYDYLSDRDLADLAAYLDSLE